MLERADFKTWWPTIELGLSEIAIDADYPELVAEVRAACEGGTAHIFVGRDSKPGFVVLKPTIHNGVKTVVVWAAWRPGENGIITYLESIYSKAKVIDAKQVLFWSVRKAFKKLAPKYGWEKVGKDNQFTVWKKRL